jgi:hypothetical protein
MDDRAMTPAVGETSGRVTSWRDFEDRFKAAMAMAACHPTEITLTDTDFGHWPLGQRNVMEAFHQWSLASKTSQCRLLAADYGGFARQHPLWVSWRTTWAHKVHCHQAPHDLGAALRPVLVLHGVIGLRLHEPLHGTGVWTCDPGALTEWLQEIDVILHRAAPGWPATTLGL